MLRIPALLFFILAASACSSDVGSADVSDAVDTSVDSTASGDAVSDAAAETDALRDVADDTLETDVVDSEPDVTADVLRPDSDDNDTSTESDTVADVDDIPVSTASVLCDVNESGEQHVTYMLSVPRMTPIDVDEVLPYEYAWSCDATGRVMIGNGVPNHEVTGGRFATRISAQSPSETFPLEPAVTDDTSSVRVPGYAVNTVPFEPQTAGTCPDDATENADCAYAMGTDPWSMVATQGDVSPWRFSFGVDENDAHVQPNGKYHYHGIPVHLVEALNDDSANSMTLVGWAADGFPMYSVEGFEDATDATSSVVELRSSYQTVATPAPGRPNVEDFPLGHFTQDWEYVAGSGDLDECNGRFGVTPEFPEGIYHYHLTKTYPFVHRCVRGTSTAGGGGR